MVMETLGVSWGNGPVSWWLVALVATTLAFLVAYVVKNNRGKLPPGPKMLPVIGNIHQMSALPHQSFWRMGQKFGPIIYVKMGVNPVVVAGTADAAREFLKNHDKSWASRPTNGMVTKIFSENYLGIGGAPLGPAWRHMRKISMLELFSQKRLEMFRAPRVEEFHLFIKWIYEESLAGNKKIPLGVKLAHLASNNITRMLLGKRFFGQDVEGEYQTKRFRKLVVELFTAGSGVTVGDSLPWLRWTNYVSGYMRYVHKLKAEMDAFLQEYLDVKKNDSPADANRGEDLVDILLRQPSETGEGHLEANAIKIVVQDLLLAGTDTSANSVEWAIAVLLRYPHIHRKLQAELDTVIGLERVVTEGDIPNLPYLQAVVKEVLRLYPPTPMSIPHESVEATTIWGYEIPAKTALFVNFYAIHRDPNLWERPLEFDPERFINHPEIDVKGNYFGLIPFGAGRRMCPALMMGLTFVQTAVAKLVQAFDISLPDGMAPEELDMSEGFMATLPRVVKLVVEAKPRLPEHLY